MKKIINKKIYLSLFLYVFFLPSLVFAQIINIDAKTLVARVSVYFSPRSGSFMEGSTFEVPIFVNTKNRSINGIEIHVNFDKNKLSIINPTGTKSIIGIWTEAPQFDNTRGVASYVGVIPGGIVTDSGLIGTLDFKAISPGEAMVEITSTSRVLLNDGLGTPTDVDFGMAKYTILQKTPDGVRMYSDTHPVQSDWYNNNTPVISWFKDPGVSGFSFVLDDKPNTVPDNTIDTVDTVKSYESLADGLWYFHIKAIKNGVWGTTGHFLIKIDTTPPAKFRPEANLLSASVISSKRSLVSFFTTDNLSGMDHYEVGIINKKQPPTASPVFVQAESPFQVSLYSGDVLEVIVRAVDKAGNVRDESIDVRNYTSLSRFFKDYPIYILLSIILIGVCLFVLHLIFGHHIVRRIRSIIDFIKKED